MCKEAQLKREALGLLKKGPFKQAWGKMENNKDAFWTKRSDAFARIISDDSLALFDFPIIVEHMDEFLSCKVEAIPGKYFRSQWAMPVRKEFEI